MHSFAARHLSQYLAKAGGEGSRGGKIIGHTRSGKPVYSHDGHHYAPGPKSDAHESHVQEKYAAHGYTADDHLDAQTVHEANAYGGAIHSGREARYRPAAHSHGAGENGAMEEAGGRKFVPGSPNDKANRRAAKVHRRISDTMRGK